MSNLANYSPYNKTYRFLMFQNQAYHQRNKLSAKPCIRSNLKYTRNQSQDNSFYNPEIRTSRKYNEEALKELGNGLQMEDGKNDSSTGSLSRSFLNFSCRSLRESNPRLDKPKLVIHKNESYEKFCHKKIIKQNFKLVQRLRSTSCQVVKKQKTERSFSNHNRYSQLIKHYDIKGTRKERLAIGSNNLLNPVLKDFSESKMGSKFLQEHMSWVRESYKKPSIRMRNSNNSWL